MALWISTANVEKAEARLRAALEGETRPAWRPDQIAVEDVRAVLDEVELLRRRLEDCRARVDRRTDKIMKLRDELEAVIRDG